MHLIESSNSILFSFELLQATVEGSHEYLPTAQLKFDLVRIKPAFQSQEIPNTKGSPKRGKFAWNARARLQLRVLFSFEVLLKNFPT